ncbi:SDR family oxidoreductase [Sphingomonas bacterium]|uniref:SDR family oxidoreductase n=1 Tax=Sphingomonas bacterium TaxID=1895847 RepID=UPI001576C35C|nr:SDR family oxidoreductase [Sphingomonas bacterium]
MTIAVTGASGQLGRLALAALQSRIPADRIVALARDPAKLADAGVAARAFDYDRPEALAPALAGVETLVLISSTEVDRRIAQHRAVIAAARDADVSRILYTSLLHADTSPLSLAESHLAAEADLRASGLGFTVLRNGWYNENYLPSIPAALDRGAFVGGSGDGRISAAARADYAEAIAAVATGDGHDGRTYELAGDDAFTLTELAAELSRATGRDIPYRNLPEPDYAAALAANGLPEGFARMIASWEGGIAGGALFDDGRQLSGLIGRPTTPMAATIAAEAA